LGIRLLMRSHLNVILDRQSPFAFQKLFDAVTIFAIRPAFCKPAICKPAIRKLAIRKLAICKPSDDLGTQARLGLDSACTMIS
jgi:hypothetical protein